jgi:hypothetical protein
LSNRCGGLSGIQTVLMGDQAPATEGMTPMLKTPVAGRRRPRSPGFIYARAWVTRSPDGETIPGIKLGRAKDMQRRESGYRRWKRDYPHLVTALPIHCVFQVDDDEAAEQLLLEHFRPFNTVRAYNAKARRTMTPEQAKFAETYGDGREVFLGISIDAVRAIMLQLGEDVVEPGVAVLQA